MQRLLISILKQKQIVQVFSLSLRISVCRTDSQMTFFWDHSFLWHVTQAHIWQPPDKICQQFQEQHECPCKSAGLQNIASGYSHKENNSGDKMIFHSRLCTNQLSRNNHSRGNIWRYVRWWMYTSIYKVYVTLAYSLPHISIQSKRIGFSYIDVQCSHNSRKIPKFLETIIQSLVVWCKMAQMFCTVVVVMGTRGHHF